jgi:hypothetical protein
MERLLFEFCLHPGNNPQFDQIIFTSAPRSVCRRTREVIDNVGFGLCHVADQWIRSGSLGSVVANLPEVWRRNVAGGNRGR